jgi:hypothetical protein
MNNFSGILLILGALYGFICAFMVFAPNATRGVFRRFPRHRVAGWILTAIALWWSALLLLGMDMGFLNAYKKLIYLLAPLAFFLIAFYMENLLAARALGGLLLLVPALMIDVARFDPSQFRYVLLVLAYVMVFKGMALVASPYLFRRCFERFVPDDAWCRRWGLAGLVFSAVLLGVGVATLV